MNELIVVQNKVYSKPTVIIANKVTGEEEIPDGVVAVLTPSMIDVLSHISIRARNSKACGIVCFNLISSNYAAKKCILLWNSSVGFSSDADMLCYMLRSECSQESEDKGRESHIYSYTVYWFSYQVIQLLCCHCSLR